VYTALRVLQQLGLVKEEKRKGFPNTVLTRLTGAGRKVARRVWEIEGILKKIVKPLEIVIYLRPTFSFSFPMSPVLSFFCRWL
jgi:DNA-binding PadR family transcriptional regulator